MNAVQLLKSINQNAAGRKVIVSEIEKDGALLDACFEDFFSTSLRTCQEVSWILVKIGEARPHLIVPYFDRMFKALENPKAHNALLRNTVRIWQDMDIPLDYRGIIFDLCFKYMLDQGHQVAIRAFSLNVCVNICKQHPELKEDLSHALELLMSIKTDNYYFPHRCNEAVRELGIIGQ